MPSAVRAAGVDGARGGFPLHEATELACEGDARAVSERPKGLHGLWRSETLL